MWEYNALLTLRRRRPAISAVLLPFSGRGGVRKARYVETLFGEEYIKLEYWWIELPSLSAADYAAGASLLGVALAALMRPGIKDPGIWTMKRGGCRWWTGPQ